MQTIKWDLLPSVISQVLFNIAIFTLILTFFGMLALKFFVRSVPLLSHAFVFSWAVFRVLVAVSALWLGVVLAGIQIPPAFSGLFTLAALCIVGWLINHDLEKRYGVSRNFPSAGFKVILTLLVLSWIFVGGYLLVAL